MKQGGCFDRFELLVVGNAKLFGKFDSKPLNASNMAVRDLILGIDRHRQGLDR